LNCSYSTSVEEIRAACEASPPNVAKMVQISEVKGNKRDNRTAAHTHIKGLGLKADGYADQQAGGFVGQAKAREVRGQARLEALFCY
jgi:hypothetical protein